MKCKKIQVEPEERRHLLDELPTSDEEHDLLVEQFGMPRHSELEHSKDRMEVHVMCSVIPDKRYQAAKTLVQAIQRKYGISDEDEELLADAYHAQERYFLQSGSIEVNYEVEDCNDIDWQ